jgi:HlyD family secretion protein
LPQDGPSPGVGSAFIGEWRRVFADRGVFSFLVVAPFFYGVFYPQPYLGQLVRKMPIAVVDVADAKVQHAVAAVSVIAARVDKLRIRAPTVALIVAEPGEAIVPGQPVMTLEGAGRRWASFNLREDQLDGLRIGSPIELLPVAAADRIEAAISEIIPRGEFATWRAARVVGDHDLNTFLVRADPVEQRAAALQPGMTVWLDPASGAPR